jgi:4-amino-4-deoxy-L-arabinose transferase-like glycosyltransferase
MEPMTVITDTRVPAAPAPPPRWARPVGRGRRLLRGRASDPAWVRPGLLGLLAVTAGLYLWDLGSSGWANSFYAAAVQAGTQSWKAFFFGSSDAANFITVDKPPASLWVMEISARIFGLNAWSLLVPQALEGVAAVAVLYLAVRRAASAGAGLLAGAVLALTPVAALMFRFDNPDALLVLLLVGAAYATTRYLDGRRVGWLAGAGALVGLAFLTKSLQAFIIVPVLAVVVLALADLPWRRRIRDLLLAGVALVAAGGWWVAIVELIPAADRPYIGGSQDNSLWNVIFGYNGFGRLTGNETGSVGGGGGGTGIWGPTGVTRMFNSAFGGQISWLLPAALALLLLGLALTVRARRTDRARAGLVLWGGWLVVTGLVFSLSKGIIHPYYTVALAPAIGAVIGIGASLAWARRAQILVRAGLAVAVGVTAVWSYVLLDRSPSWHPWLRWVVVIAGLAAALALIASTGPARRLRTAVAGVCVAACLAAPLASTLSTVTTPHSGAIPSAGPTVAASFGGGRGFGGIRGFGAGFGGAAAARRATGTGVSAGGFGAGGFGAGGFGAGGFGAGTLGGGNGTGFGGGTAPGIGGATGTAPGRAAGRGAFGGGGAGGLLGASTPSAALVKVLEENRSSYTWVAAVTAAESASGYQLATGDPVMAIGGFNGTDPAPSLATFEKYVAEKKIHWYIEGSGFGGRGAGGSGDASQIAAWVAAHFTAQTVGGTTIYDLTATPKV